MKEATLPPTTSQGPLANQVSSVSTISDVSSTGYMVGEIDEGGKSSTYNLSGTPANQSPGRVAQSVTCLATDACLTADPGVASSIPARYHTFVEIDHEIISTVILLLPLIYSRSVVVSYKRKYVHKLLVNACSSLPRKKCG